MPSIGERLAQALELREMSQAALSREMGNRGIKTSPTEINRVIHGIIDNPGLSRLVAYADILEVSVDYLLARTDDPGIAWNGHDRRRPTEPDGGLPGSMAEAFGGEPAEEDPGRRRAESA